MLCLFICVSFILETWTFYDFSYYRSVVFNWSDNAAENIILHISVNQEKKHPIIRENWAILQNKDKPNNAAAVTGSILYPC